MKDVELREFELSDWEDAWELWEAQLGQGNDESWKKIMSACF
jgi:hypothetical protein